MPVIVNANVLRLFILLSLFSLNTFSTFKMTHNSNYLVIEGLFLEKTQELIEASSLFRIQLLNRSVKANIPDNILISQQLASSLQLEALYLLNFRRPLSQSCFNRFLHTYFSFIE